MYETINQVLRKLAMTDRGADTWTRICPEADLSETGFRSLQKLPDEIACGLVGAASKVLGAPAE